MGSAAPSAATTAAPAAAAKAAVVEEKKEEEAGLALFRAYRGLPKNKALIKLLGEQGVRAIMQKSENYYLQDQQKEMHKADATLYFVIDEKNNSIELTDRKSTRLNSSHSSVSRMPSSA